MTPEQAVERARVRLVYRPLDLMDVENLVNSVYREGFQDGTQEAFKTAAEFCIKSSDQLTQRHAERNKG